MFNRIASPDRRVAAKTTSPAFTLRLRRSAPRRAVVVFSVLAALAIVPAIAVRFAVPARASATPHVLVVLLENKGYVATLGSCAADPYYCGLGSQYASVTGWSGISHPSLPNYLAVTTGSTQGCSTDTCKGDYTPSLGGQLNTAGIPWVSWAESMPTACDLNDAKPYVWHHNPFTHESDSACATHDLPYPGASGAVAALNGANAPDFVWITPNDTDNMHTGTIQQGDAWLKANIAPVLSSPWFTAGNATVIITMDESDAGTTNAIPMVVVSSNAKGKGNVPIAGNLYGTLRSVEEAYGLPLLGAAAQPSSGDVSALFGASGSPPPTPTPTVTGTPSGTPSPTATPTATPTPTSTPTPTPTPSPTPVGGSVVCNNDVSHDTAALTTAIGNAPANSTVAIAAGTCALNGRLPIHQAVTIDGAGANATFLVQHVNSNIFQITAPYVTVENVNLNTATYNAGLSVPKDRKPAVLFSNASHTSVLNVTAESGDGFGLRITGPNPCDTYQTQGTVVTNLDITNTGTGGNAALDIDCTNGAVLTNITVHGDYIALFQDENVSLNGEIYTADAKTCQAPWYITGMARNITINEVDGGGPGITKAPTVNIVVTDQGPIPGC
jgi:hypothetical protein